MTATPSPSQVAPLATRNRRALLARRTADLDTILSPDYLAYVLGQRADRPASQTA